MSLFYATVFSQIGNRALREERRDLRNFFQGLTNYMSPLGFLQSVLMEMNMLI